MSEFTDDQIRALSDAMWQVLDDMGEHGKCVCGFAKAQARVAYEPFRLAEAKELGEEVPVGMSLEAAEAIIDDVERN